MKIKRMISVCFCIVFLVAVVCSAAGDKIDLKLRLKAGESHELKMIQNQDITQTTMGQEQKMTQVQEVVMVMNCLSVDANGDMDVEMTYKSMKIKMEGPMGTMEVDSANPKPADPNRPDQQIMNAMISAMTGGKIQMKMTPTGKTSQIRGMKEMLARMKEKISSSSPMMPMEAFDKMFDEKEVKEMTGNMIGSFPAGPVAVGDSWYDTVSMNFMVPIDVDTTYMLKQVKDGTAYIDAIAKIDLGDSSKPLLVDANNQVFMQMSGTINATNQVDEKTGLTKKSDMKMNFTGVMKMGANPQMPEGMAMPMTIVGSASVEMIK